MLLPIVTIIGTSKIVLILSVTKQSSLCLQSDEDSHSTTKLLVLINKGEWASCYLHTLQKWWLPCSVIFRWVENIQTYRFWHFSLFYLKDTERLRTCTECKYGKYMVIFGALTFLGVVGACACNWYQAAFSSPSAALVRGYPCTILLNQPGGPL